MSCIVANVLHIKGEPAQYQEGVCKSKLALLYLVTYRIFLTLSPNHSPALSHFHPGLARNAADRRAARQSDMECVAAVTLCHCPGWGC